ncbi:potassium transporter TrkA [Nonlabens sp. YIK11]|uniref:potassium channel family protein n=1 Tax=Nonlabens sp. YIK11 TaxID=1453349 RepID=UPI0006DCDE15|nr:potassium channel protein [Nonlabens sp. YIK11]KQC31885.1 potassium transporter TrkA [Nonlabens sp. YIK11]KQC34428.1 potassium transporter TrkA [Nonlabens sp. YIK11]
MRNKITIAISLLTSVMVTGCLGYKFMLGLSWIDALYMTVITITTVGYREIGDPSPEAKLFTIFIILTSVVIVGYSVSVISEYLLTRNSLQARRAREKKKYLNSMENHIIVCGYGRNGKQAVAKLQDYKRDFIIIEKDQQVIDDCQLDNKYFYRGNANEDEVLQSAGIDKASVLITALPDDADNLFIVLSARQLNKDLKIISRASEETSYKKLKLAGADNVILPDQIGGQHMASLIVSPDLIEFWDNLSYGGDDGVNLEQVSFEQMFDHQNKCTIIDLNLRQKTGCTIIGYKSPDGEYVVNPSPETVIGTGSKIIVVGNSQQIAQLQKSYRIHE